MFSIIVIDDDPDATQVLKAYTSLLSDVEVTGYLSADAALENLFETPPDMLIVDLLLPGSLDGFDLIQTLQSNSAFANVICVAMSASDPFEKRGRAFREQCDYVLDKPVRYQIWSELIQKLTH